MTRLVVRDLVRSIGGAVILDAVDFEVEAGTRIALIGPSGSGKSTLLRTIGGFDRPDRGTIELGGRRLDGPGAHVPPRRRRIGYVPQEGALFPHLTAAANIGFGAPGAERRTTVERVADVAGVDRELLARYPHELSGGQQQRVALGRALATRPEAILLDEPFSALDTGLRSAVREAVIQVLERAAITTVLVTHDQTEALQFGQAIGVLRAGRLIQTGTPTAVWERPVDLDAFTFLGPANVLRATVSGDGAQTALGRVAIDNDRRRGPGPVVVAVRPAQIALTPIADGVGTVIAIRDGGARVTVVARVGDETVQADLSRPEAAGIAPGDAVDLRITGRASAYPAP